MLPRLGELELGADELVHDVLVARRRALELAGQRVRAGLGRVNAVAATGRHYALVADNVAGAEIVDRRAETALPDTHLKTWELREE